MRTKEDRIKLYECKQTNGKYRKEIENSGVFLSDIDEMLPYIAQQPNGQWQAFDFEPTLTPNGWDRVGDRPDNIKIEGDIGLKWTQTLCYNERYHFKIVRIRKSIRVSGYKQIR